MRIKTEFDGKRDTALISLASNCYTDALPLVRELFVANAEFDASSNGFLLGCALLVRDFCGELLEFENRKIGGDYAEAVRTALPSTPTVGRVMPDDRALSLGEIDVAIHPARHRDTDWPADADVPLMVVSWSGDFVPPGARRSAEQAIGRYFTNAGLVADETLVSVALGLMTGGNRLRRLLVPAPPDRAATSWDALTDALAIAGIDLVAVAQRNAVPARAKTPPTQAIIMLSHTASDRVLSHFRRLRHEVQGLMPAFFVLNNPQSVSTDDADIVIDDADMQEAMPQRYAEYVRNGARVDRGFVDLVTATAAVHPLIGGFDYLWVIEYDVDYSGNWADFFGPLMDNPSDLLISRVQTEEQFPRWVNWAKFRHPSDLRQDQRLASFMPASRQSRHFIDAYRKEMARPDWQGHSEATMPSVAAYHGLRIEDMLVGGRFALSGEAPLDHLTYGYRPARSQAYFHESADAFDKKGRLYHPVKAVTQVDGHLVTRGATATPPAKAPRNGVGRKRTLAG